MQKNLVAFVGLIVVFLVAVSAFAVIRIPYDTSGSSASAAPFYLGVTYCGSSVAEAKQLIDRVKNCTNLFVLQSGSLMNDFDAAKQIGDCAVNSGLNLMLYYGVVDTLDHKCYDLANLAEQRWGSSFLGLYFNDEPGGKMLDKTGGYVGRSIFRDADGSIVVHQSNSRNSTMITFYPSGELAVNKNSFSDFVMGHGQSQGDNTVDKDQLLQSSKIINYYTNGTVVCRNTNLYAINNTTRSESSGPFTYQADGTVLDQNGQIVTDQGNISQFQPYQEVLSLNPFETPVKTAASFVSSHQSTVNELRGYSDTALFTADYALYWYDYQSGYDTVFAEFVGNESRERHIALCRGAAESFGKDWGAIITWKYNQAPYLESGDELYNDLALAYNSGAKYGIVFTYPNITAYGTLTDEHFMALQRFWNTLKTNPNSLGKTESEVAYIVPADYGFGFRTSTDTLWGQFPADELSAKIYSDTVALTGRYGAKLNILYDGPETASQLSGYSTVYYYNQTVT